MSPGRSGTSRLRRPDRRALLEEGDRDRGRDVLAWRSALISPVASCARKFRNTSTSTSVGRGARSATSLAYLKKAGPLERLMSAGAADASGRTGSLLHSPAVLQDIRNLGRGAATLVRMARTEAPRPSGVTLRPLFAPDLGGRPAGGPGRPQRPSSPPERGGRRLTSRLMGCAGPFRPYLRAPLDGNGGDVNLR